MSLQGMLVRLRSLGSCLATCVKLPSAVRNNGRKAFALLMVLVMGVRLPVFAADIYDGGWVSPDPNIGVSWICGDYNVNVFNGYFPASFERNESASRFIWGSVLPGQDGSTSASFSSASPFYIEVFFPVSVYNEVSVTTNATFKDIWNIRFGLGRSPSASLKNYYPTSVSFVLDGNYTLLSDSDSNNRWSGIPSSFGVSRYWGFRFEFPSFSYSIAQASNYQVFLSWAINATYNFTENLEQGIYEEIVINTGVLEDIKGTLTDIETSTGIIQNDVSDIKDSVLDTSEQLQDPDSNIWQAAGSAISDAVTGLFVPEQAELDAKLKEVEDIVIDKLGDTYEVIERVDQYEDQLVGGFTGGGRQYNFHFPGISVPLPDGTVTILPAQDVSIENDAFIVFRDLLGTGVALLCGFAAVHIAHDFVICIISGVSYWGFIRGRHNE